MVNIKNRLSTKGPYEATEEHPYHLSVGGLVYNTEGDILAHLFTNYRTTRVFFPKLYTLMRETVEKNETPIQALERGLVEEFGIRATTFRFLGSRITSFLRGFTEVEKTTLWFSCIFESNGEERCCEEDEGQSVLVWSEPNLLINVMKEQGKLETNQDESDIIMRHLKIIKASG